MNDTDLIEMAQRLIREETVSPEDGACQRIISGYLAELGFDLKPLPFGPVQNLWAIRRGTSRGPIFAFAGHTDVVPPGDLDDWQHPPFAAHLEGDILHGRGAADMKGALAAMLAGAGRFLAERPAFEGALAFLITSDEEDRAVDGTFMVMEWLKRQNIGLDYCLIGEPSSSERLGDTVRIGRRGSLSGMLKVRGREGHVAYPEQVVNPIHKVAPALAELAACRWDEGNDRFPPTSFQVSNIVGGTGAENVVPGKLSASFNFRFSPASSDQSLIDRFKAILDSHGLDYELVWQVSGQPFLTEGGRLIPAVQAAIAERLGYQTEVSTSGGTSDGRFIAPSGAEVVELGPCNASIHKVNERVSVKELLTLADLYADILKRLLPAHEGKG